MTNYADLSKEQAKQVCYNLGQLAKRLNVTQQTISEKTGYQQPNIARLYSGRVSPKLEVIYCVLHAINEAASTSYVLRGTTFVEDEPAAEQTGD